MAKKKDERSMDEITDAILLNDEQGVGVVDDEDALIDELAALIDGDDEPIGKSQPGPGDVHASGADPKAGHMAGCRCKDCRKKVAKGYAVGKNPNSHKRKGQSANRGFKGPKPSDSKLEGGHLYLYEARRSIRAARLAKDKGDKGKASYHANEARQWMRGARNPSKNANERIKGITFTEGGKAHEQAAIHERDARTLMSRARKAKARGENSLHVKANVQDARETAREGRKFRNKSRVTKRFEIPVKIQKADKKEQIVYGWASPVSEFGTSIIDKQGDVLDIDDVRKAAHDFMLNSRSGGSMHKDIGIDKASVVESVVLSTELQKALGIEMPYEGWFIGVKIHDNAVWKKIEDGEYTGFSIGGSGVREAMEEAVEKKSMYGPGKNPNSHKRRGANMASEGTRSESGKLLLQNTGGSKKRVSGNPAHSRNIGRKTKGALANRTGNTAFKASDTKMLQGARPTSRGSAARRLFQAKESLVAAREAKKKGNLGEASMHAKEARMAVRSARGRQDSGLKTTTGAHAATSARLATDVKNSLMAGARRSQNQYDKAHLVRSARANAKTARKWTNVARVNKGYAVGKNPNSHRRKAFESVMRGNPASPRNSAAVGKVKQHLNEAKNWLDEARTVRDYDQGQAAYAAQQARKALRRARGSSTKTDSGKSLQARRARSFARQSRDERD